jgi:uncharacterized protein
MGIADKNTAQEQLRALEHPRAGDLYDHYKGGDYRVVAVSLKEDNLEPLVTYQSLKTRQFWTRTLEVFTEPVRLADGTTRPRFLLIG